MTTRIGMSRDQKIGESPRKRGKEIAVSKGAHYFHRPSFMISLVYVSSAVETFSQAELKTLLETSRRNNALTGISGLLLYKDGNFMQVIEGEAAEIHKLHSKISHDPRHGGLITLTEKIIQHRQFPEWKMGFKNLSDPGVRTLPGYSEFLNIPLTLDAFSAHPSRTERLLQTFKAKM